MRKYSKYLSGLAVLAALEGLAMAQNRPLSAGRISILGENPFRLHIQTSAPVTPQIQMVYGPDRLVIDLPNTAPGAGFHGVPVQKPEIRGVRTGVFSRAPLVTRVVVDLNAPQWYQVAPDSTGLTVTIGGVPADAGNAPSTIGWVSAKGTVKAVNTAAAARVENRTQPSQSAPANAVNVQFANGLLSIYASNASLSEVLYQIQKKTGAEIAIPSGTEQERVAVDFGPGTPNEVLAELLNGSRLNFVVIGSEADPNVLRSVLLTRKGSDEDPPARFAQAYTPPVEAVNIQDENPQPPTPAGPPPRQPIPVDGPPPDPPQD